MDKVIILRCESHQVEAWDKAAGGDRKRSAWMREILDREAEPVKEKAERIVKKIEEATQRVIEQVFPKEEPKSKTWDHSDMIRKVDNSWKDVVPTQAQMESKREKDKTKAREKLGTKD